MKNCLENNKKLKTYGITDKLGTMPAHEKLALKRKLKQKDRKKDRLEQKLLVEK